MSKRLLRFPPGRRVVALLLVAAAATLPACQVWNNWLEFLKWKDKSGTAVGGNTQTFVSPTPVTVGPGPALDKNSAQLVAALPQVRVYKIALPLGTFSGNEQVWSQLNEDALDSKTSVLLAQNGLRAAVGPIARWPAIAKIIDTPGAATEQITCSTDGRSSLKVVTRPNVTDQIVVSIDRDLQQQMRTFERCDNGFQLSLRAVADKNKKPSLLVQLEPVVTLGTVAVVRRETDVGVTRTGFTSEEEFGDLRLAVPLAADQFLAVSTSDPKNNRFSVGSLWLSDLDRVPGTETVLVFVPLVAGQK